MKSSLLACAALVVVSGGALAQSAPLRGLGLLALESSSASQRDFGAAGGRGSMLETPDGGGGSVGARAVRGTDAEASAHRDGEPGLSPEGSTVPVITPIDAALPAATPKHPSYRWQALVPGALK